MDVPLIQGPVAVGAERLARPMVLLNGDPDLESCGLEPEVEATGTGIETNDSWRWHGGTLEEMRQTVKT